MRLIITSLLLASAAACARDRQEIATSPEALLPGPIENVAILVRGEPGEAYRLVAVTYLIDGEQVFNRSSPAGTELTDAARVYRGYLPAGEHQLEVVVGYEVNESRILDDSRFEVRRDYALSILDESTAIVEAVVAEREPRLALLVRYEPEEVASAR